MINSSSLRTRYLPLYVIYSNFSVKRKTQLILLLPIFILQAISELLSLGSVIPFITALTNPELILNQIEKYIFLKDFLNITTPETVVLPFFIIFIALVLFAALFRLLSLYLLHRVTYSAGIELSIDLFRKIISQEYKFFINTNTNQIITLLTNKTPRAVNSILCFVHILNHFILAIFILFGFIFLSPVISIMIFLILGLAYFFILIAAKNIFNKNSLIQSNNENDLVRFTREAFSGIRLIIIDKIHDYFISKFSITKSTHDNALLINNFLGHSPKIIMESLGIVILSSLAFYLIKTEYTFLDLVPFFVVIGLGAQKLLPIFQQVYYSFASIESDYESSVQVANFCKINTNYSVYNKTKETINFKKYIEFKNVTFKYNSKITSLKNINTKILCNKKIGIVGHTGSGKSTFIDLLMGLNKPTSGEILVDGIELNNTNINKWHNCISHVSQNIYISDIPIKNNIAFGKKNNEIDSSKIDKISKMLDLDNFIENLKDGLNSYIGESGNLISGGEKQKIALARALYKKFNTLILDEATSAMDNKSEELIMNEIFDIQNKTIIIIAHRLTTVKNCDIILEFESGKIINEGTFSELLEKSPSFREIAKNLK